MKERIVFRNRILKENIKNIIVNLCDLGLGNGFLNMTLKRTFNPEYTKKSHNLMIKRQLKYEEF